MIAISGESMKKNKNKKIKKNDHQKVKEKRQKKSIQN